MPANLPAVLDDPRRIAQALGNLLSNAIKITPGRRPHRHHRLVRADGGVSFAVEDTGIGMAEETVAAAMEPFRQLDGSLARKFEGAGLGLSLARALTELHGGTVGMVSAVGSGTTVTVSLPVSRSEKRALSA